MIDCSVATQSKPMKSTYDLLAAPANDEEEARASELIWATADRLRRASMEGKGGRLSESDDHEKALRRERRK